MNPTAYNVEDASYMREYDFDYEKVHSAAKEAAIGRIRMILSGSPTWSPKVRYHMGNESYALEGALSNVDERSVDTNLLSLLTPLLEKVQPGVLYCHIAACFTGEHLCTERQ